MTALVILALAVGFASAVETIEAMSVVLAVGITQGYKPALQGAFAAIVLLAIFVAAGGLPLVRLVPLRWLQLGLGVAMFYIGQKWLRKAILRASGRKALHTEQATYEETQDQLGAGKSGRRLSFGAVMLEGSEVLAIIVGLGAASHHLELAGISAVVAVGLVVITTAIVAKPLANAPENSIKLGVSVLLLALSFFWVSEGIGLHLPGSDAWILVFVALVASFAWLTIRRLKVPVGAEAA